MPETPSPPSGPASSPPESKPSVALKTEAPAAGGPPPGLKPPVPPKPRNPIWRMMGIPNVKLKLPSRNWLIFLSITGSFTAALFYDKHTKKKVQQKWCDLVSHLADEPLDASEMPRKVTVFLSAPPGDSLSPAREHFREYVKPILVAAAIDWEVIEGRKEGDVQRSLAQNLRSARRRAGEGNPEYVEDDEKQALKVAMTEWKKTRGIHDYDGIRGDIVLGRHTWKEYIRGLHEGWLGPVEPPAPALTPEIPGASPSEFAASEPAFQDILPSSDSEAAKAQDATPESPSDSADPQESPKPKPEYTPFVSTSQYVHASTPPSMPSSFDPSEPVPFPHILGFLNTPTRLYRFLTRRYLADDVGRQVARIVLNFGQDKWDYQYKPVTHGNMEDEQRMDLTGPNTIQGALEHEEGNWRKNDMKLDKDKERQERVWLNEIALDPRIAGRMTRFTQLPGEEEERAVRIAAGKEGPMERETVSDRDEL